METDEATIERQCVEEVLKLGGGELERESLKFRARINPAQEYGEIEDREWGYWYEGFPEWAGEDFGDKYESGVEYLTLISTDACYGSGAPAHFTIGDKFYLMVRDYCGSGETECPLGSVGDDEKVGEDSTEGMDRCPLCEADKGEDHGHIYIGPTVESVYKHIAISCAGCRLDKSDMGLTTPECDCVAEDGSVEIEE